MKSRFLPIAVFLLFSTAIRAPAYGEGREEPAPLTYRRILAPADRMADWPKGEGKYLPLETREFERLLAQVNSADDPAPPSQSSRIRKAEYRAALEGERLLAGQADLEIALSADPPVLLPLDPCNLAIRNALWIFSTAEKPTEEQRNKALLGASPRGKLSVLAERGGKLHFDWSLAGRRDVNGNVVISCEIPSALASALVLDLPEDLLPQVDNGMVTGPFREGEGSVNIAKSNLQCWRIELGGNSRFQLKLIPRAPRESAGGLPLLHETRTYDISPRGVDVSAQWKIQDRGERTRQIAAILDPGLELVAAQCGETAIDWTLESFPDGQGKRAILNLPPSLPEGNRTLRLSAMAPLTMDRLWRLPCIRPEGAIWEDGTIGIAALRPLSIDRLTPAGCSQTAAGPLAEPRIGESLQFRCFNPEATVAVALSLHRGEVTAKAATAVEIGGGEITARTAGDFLSADSPQFALEAKVTPAWRIDDVTAVPVEALADWSLEVQPDGDRKLSIRLAKPIEPEQPLRLIVTARRLRLPTERGLKFSELQPLRFSPPVESRRWISLKAAGANELKIQGSDQPRRVLLKDLAAAERDLFNGVADALSFSEDATSDAEVVVESRRPEYSATLHTEMEAIGGLLQETWSLRCVPESAQVERILVQYSEKCTTPPRWKLAGANGVELTARQWSKEEAAASGLNNAAETWEIALSRPQNMPFELQGSRETAFSEPRPAALISLPEASRQNGTLVIRRTAKSGIRIENRRLKCLPPEPPSLESFPAVWATFSYEPAHDAAPSNQPPLMLAPEGRQLSSACAWSALLESWHEPSGVSRYAAVWDLQLGGREQARITLPEGVDSSAVSGVWIDDQPAAWKPILEIAATAEYANPNSFSVALPAEKRFATLSVEFSVRNKPLGTMGTIASYLPKIDLPVLSSAWRLWLPSGYEAAGGQSPGLPFYSPRASIGKQIFGPLGRDANERKFRIFSAEDWAAIAGDPRQTRCRRNLEKILGLMRDSLDGAVSAQNSSLITWQDFLASGSGKSNVPRLLIDCPALDRLGISGQTVLPAAAADDAANRVEELLQKNRLALLASGDTVLLTSQISAALYRRQWSAQESPVAGIIAPGPLADRLSEATKDETERRYLPAKVWAQLPVKPESPWNRSRFSGTEPFELQGWNAARRDLSLQEAVSIGYIHRPAFRIAGIVTFLIVVAVGSWFFSRRLPVLLGLAAGFSLAALMLPDAFAALASSAMLGMIFCMILPFVYRKRTAGKTETPPAAQLDSTVYQPVNHAIDTPGNSAAKLLLIAAIFLFASRSKAEEPPKKDAPAASASPVYRVFVPTDAANKLLGDKVYVSESFYNELFRRAEAVSEKPQAWLLTSASYRGSLVRESSSGQLTLDILKAQFDLHTFSRAAYVRIPLRRDEAELVADSATLDGRHVQIQWEADGAAIALTIDEPGDYRLDLSLKPKLRSANGRAGFDASIPRVAGANLELLLPSDPLAVDVRSALGKVAQESEPQRIVADLGPADRLAVEWPQGGTGAAVAEIDELLWLKVQPGSVVLDVRLKGNAAAGRLEKLQLAVDPRLRLQPLSGAEAPTVQVRNPPDGPQIIALKWPQPLSEQSTVALSFLMTGASGVGNLRLPAFEVQQLQTGKRWLGVSVDPLLDYEPQWFKTPADSAPRRTAVEGQPAEQPATKVEAFAANDFLKAWGTAAVAPLAAYRLGAAADWSLSTKPREPVTTAEPALALSFDRERVDLDFTAQLATASGYVFQYRLLGPKELSVQAVSLKKDGMEMVSRWARDADGTITVFLSGPAEGRQELKIRGAMPLSGKSSLPLPALRLAQANSESMLVRVYRRPGVLLELTTPLGATSELFFPEPSLADSRGLAERGRLVRAYRVAEKSPTLGDVALKPNRPIFKAKQIVWLRQEDRQWRAGIDCRIQVVQGLVDEIQLDAAPSWKGPYSISSNAAIDAAGAPGELRRLAVVPPEAIAKEYVFSISSPIKFELGERPGLPQIALRQAAELARWAIMPRYSQGQDINWEINGLNEVKMPDDIAADFDPKLFHACEATVENPKAVLRSQGQNAAASHIGLADLRVAWQPDGTLRGAATFDLTPGGISVCPLKLPKGCDLIAATVDGLPIQPQAQLQGGWRLNLNSDRLPQRVAVVYRGTTAAADRPGTHEFAAPTLGEIPVSQTLWTVAGPSRLSPGECRESEPTGALQREWIRFRQVSGMIESTAGLFSVDNEETRRWYQLNVRYWAAARSAVLRELLPISQTEAGRSMRKEMESLERRQSQFAERADMADVLRHALADSPKASEPAQWWNETLFDSAGAVSIHQEGRLTSLDLDYTWAEKSQAWNRVWYATIILIIAALAIWVIRKGLLEELFYLIPSLGYAGGAALGLAWWLWLSPSWLGLAIVLISLASWGWFWRRTGVGNRR